MTEKDLKRDNPWIEVANMYKGNSFLYSKNDAFVCNEDKQMIDEFNNKVSKEYQYNLNVPAYPWYGNPLTAKVIVLSLNPGYVDHETVIAKVLMSLQNEVVDGYCSHLRKMLTFECDGFFPKKEENRDITSRDLANLDQLWYWERRLKNFLSKQVNKTEEQIEKDYESILDKFAVVQFIGYSSKEFKSFPPDTYLKSQEYTRNLLKYILENRDTMFVIARNKVGWIEFLKELYTDNESRFVQTKSYRGQWLTFKEKEEGEQERDYEKILNAFMK